MRIYYADVEMWVDLLRNLKESSVRSASLSRYKERKGIFEKGTDNTQQKQSHRV
jgi:hypothetical protein